VKTPERKVDSAINPGKRLKNQSTTAVKWVVSSGVLDIYNGLTAHNHAPGVPTLRLRSGQVYGLALRCVFLRRLSEAKRCTTARNIPRRVPNYGLALHRFLHHLLHHSPWNKNNECSLD